MASRVVTYDTWSEEFGDYGPRWAGQQRDNGAGLFTALNMVVYKNGSIGPRPGIKAYNWSAVPVGVVTGLFYAPFPGKTAIFTVDDDLYHADSEQATDAVAGTASGEFDVPTTRVEGSSTWAGRLYITSAGDKAYEFADIANTLSDLTADSQGGRAMVLHGERMFIGGGSPIWRTQYSEPADFDNYPALNYFDIFGPGGTEINNLISLGSRLVVQNEDNLWLYQGVPGLDSLRKIIRTGLGVARTPGAIVAQGDDLWYATRNGTLGWSNGSVTDGSRWERLDLGTERVRGVYDPFEDVVLLVAHGGAGLMLRQGVWTRHSYPSALTNLATNRSAPGTLKKGFVLTNGGGVSAAAVFYAQVNDVERPGFTGDTFANVGDNSSTPNAMYLHLPEYRPPANTELIVREVKVDFTKWETGQAETTHFDVTVRALSRYDTDGYTDSAPLSFDEPNAAAQAGATGTDERANFSFGDQGSSSGFQIRIDNIRACAIRSVSVWVDEVSGRSR